MSELIHGVCFPLLCLVGQIGGSGAEPASEDESPRVRLERLEILELTGGDLDAVLGAYRELASDGGAPEATRARASWKVALIEKARGNLEAALAALEQVLARAPEDAAERDLATRALDGLRRGDAIAGIHDWYDDLVANETIRAELFRLTTELLSPDSRRRRDAARSLRAYGKIALPVLRGALRSAGGAGRLALAEVAVAIGDWSYLGDLAAAPDRRPFEEFVAGIAEWPDEQRAALRRFVTASPKAPPPEVAREVVAALDAPPGSTDDGGPPEEPCTTLEGILPETVRKTFDGVHVVTLVAPEHREALIANLVACLETQLALSRGARAQLPPRLRHAYEHLEAGAVAGDDGLERFAQLLEKLFELELPPGSALLDLPAETHPRATPPSPARVALWEKLLASTPPSWRQTVFLTMVCDLPWRPELVAKLASWLREPVAASGDPETDMAHYSPILQGLVRLHTATLDSGEVPEAQAAQTFARFRREVVLLEYENFASAVEELGGGALANPEASAVERWAAQYDLAGDLAGRSGRSRRAGEALGPSERLAAFRISRSIVPMTGAFHGGDSVRAYLEILAEKDYGIAFVAPRIPTALVARGGLSDRNEGSEFRRQLVGGLVDSDFHDREIAVLAAAHALHGTSKSPTVPLARLRDLRLPAPRDLVGRRERVTLAEILESTRDLHGRGRSGLVARMRGGTSRSPSDAERPDDILREVAAFVREAVDDVALPIEIRERAFAAVRIASLESLTVIASELGRISSGDERVVTRISDVSAPLPDWFLALVPEERPAAVRTLAAQGGALREAAIVLALYLPPPATDATDDDTTVELGSSIPESERLGWLLDALRDDAAKLDARTIRTFAASLYRHDLPETGEVLELLAERVSPRGVGRPNTVERIEQDRVLLETWSERARSTSAGSAGEKEEAQ